MPEKNDKELLRRYHEEGDLAAREQLIEQYMSLVRSLARRYSYRGEQLEDLTVQLGRSPTIAELAKAANVTDEEVLEALESGRAYSSLSLSTGGSADDEGELDPLESLGTE